MPLNIKHLDYIRSIPEYGPRLYEIFTSMKTQIDNLEQQTNANMNGRQASPGTPNALNVTAADGIFDAKITDTNPFYQDQSYFLEHSTSPNFSSPHVIHLGPSRNWRGNLGNQTLYWRAFSQYSTSVPSGFTYHGGTKAPQPVIGGGVVGPIPQSSSGSGTAPTSGIQGGAGYGLNPYRPNSAGQAPVR